jgi:hypothetical protein
LKVGLAWLGLAWLVLHWAEELRFLELFSWHWKGMKPGLNLCFNLLLLSCVNI